MDSQSENHKQPALNTASLASAPKEAVLSADKTRASDVGQRSGILPDSSLVEFQTLYERHFGKSITKKEALEKGIRLMKLVEAVLKNSIY
jgi:hypothetical protein